ncbi:MAG: hypothetical protein P1U87_22150, partial [Verrucomicrobiales bacterium]|nr:hypothetical protein [Verrucomicrobiales bacterium]
SMPGRPILRICSLTLAATLLPNADYRPRSCERERVRSSLFHARSTHPPHLLAHARCYNFLAIHRPVSG